MTTLKFKCTLLSDVILNQKAANDGPNKTLDFIPGSCFLGIVASKLYPELKPEVSWEIFHSGNVIFGDAHPSLDGVRGLRTPLSMYVPKLSASGNEIYIHHKTSDEIRSRETLKQLRHGFNRYENGKFVKINTITNYAIKSAYDAATRKSMDEKLFGYESLGKGLELYFEVVVKNESLVDAITEALVGRKHVGRSRSAQFGLVKIEPFEYQDVASSAPKTDYVEVYADSRLIFLDEFGIPTYRPSAKDLGLDGDIQWEMTQLRTFQYAPWNYKRSGFDADRCGIEKGSVFVVRLNGDRSQNLASTYVGAYNNEGFGKVIYNPDFLAADSEGRAQYQPVLENRSAAEQQKPTLPDTPLIQFLVSEQRARENTERVYNLVNKWKEEAYKKFSGEAFASQWGKIRTIAQQCLSLDEAKTQVQQYLQEGIASSKWKDRGRYAWFENLLEGEELNLLPDRFARMAIVNLASEMAKKIQEER